IFSLRTTLSLFLSITPPPPISTLFPYTTLFRSPEATALLAVMLLQDSRRHARLDEAGDLVLLEVQDRQRWDHKQIADPALREERSEEHTSELQSPYDLVCRLLLEKKKKKKTTKI